MIMDTVSKDKRAYVRGDLHFKVQFRVVAREEYQTVKEIGDQFLTLDREEVAGTDSPDGRNAQFFPNPYMTDFLFETNEKLDQILALLSKKEVHNDLLNQGTGMNISGSGMNIIVDEPIELGNILHTSFVLSRFPVIFVRVFGEVVRITPISEDGRDVYDLGIKFLYLNPDDREKIIACVFQSQRRALRKRKKQREAGKVSL
jgi:hypothetical protein